MMGVVGFDGPYPDRLSDLSRSGMADNCYTVQVDDSGCDDGLPVRLKIQSMASWWAFMIFSIRPGITGANCLDPIGPSAELSIDQLVETLSAWPLYAQSTIVTSCDLTASIRPHVQ